MGRYGLSRKPFESVNKFQPAVLLAQKSTREEFLAFEETKLYQITDASRRYWYDMLEVVSPAVLLAQKSTREEFLAFEETILYQITDASRRYW